MESQRPATSTSITLTHLVADLGILVQSVEGRKHYRVKKSEPELKAMSLAIRVQKVSQ